MSIPRLAIHRPVTMFMISGIVVLLGFAFYLAYRPLPPCDDGTCDTRRQGRLRWVVWLGTAIVAATLFATYMVNF